MKRFFATTPKGMEAPLADELQVLGAQAIGRTRAGCSFEGALETAYRVCLWSRVASRVLLPLATFPASDEEALYQGVRAIDWAAHLSPSHTLAVDFAASRSRLTHTHYGALRTKDAIVDRIREETGARPSVRTDRPDVRVNVHLAEDVATLSIDLSGESLHRRGWREAGAEAPLKENLAAAILLLAGWPELARSGAPLVDPMCGSGTLLIEAALIAADRAPGLSRQHFGFLGWRGHEPATWRRLVEEARAREITDPKRLPRIIGYDQRSEAVRVALANVERAGLRGRVHVERRELSACEPPPSPVPDTSEAPRGLFVCNPPYGERLGQTDELVGLYQQLGDVLRRRFTGWHAAVFTGNPELARRIGLRPVRRHVLWNGAIECRLLELPISRIAPVQEEGPRWRVEAARPSPGAEAFRNRVEKNLHHLRKWARREDVHCFRVYDADLPEYAVAVDLYEDAAHVAEYEPPKTVDPARAEQRLRDVRLVLPEALGIAPENLFLKVRRRQKGGAQYEKLGAAGARREVREGGLRFLVNLSDYVDTGLFLDHRIIREMIRQEARGRRFLNLFCYTASATVYAVAGGARSTLSLDLSNTYLDWAADNLALNGVRGPAHRLQRADCLEWLRGEAGARRRGVGERFGLILLAPPTFSRSKGMEGTFDVQRDHADLLRDAAELLEPDGVLYFSNFLRRFKLEAAALPDLHVEDITPRTIPPDFARNPRIHSAFRITHARRGR